MKFNPYKHPGTGFRKIMCDVCYKMIYQKDAIYIRDKWNLQNNLVVCREDADNINEQIKPIIIKERGLTNPKTARPPQQPQYAVNENDTILPTAPLLVLIKPHPLNPTLILTWTAPVNPGSSGIIGYSVRRANPQDHPYITLTQNSQSNNTFYEDASADLSTDYSYAVAAINSFGTGPYSDPGYYPYNLGRVFDYLLVSQDDSILTTGSNDRIIL